MSGRDKSQASSRARFAIGGLLLAATLAVAAHRPVSGQQPRPRENETAQLPPVGNLAQVMRGILFPSSNLIFNVQTHNPSDPPKAPRPDPAADQGGFSWVNWGDGIYSPWQMVDVAAIALAESAPLMLTPGRLCENGTPVPVERPDWIGFTRELADAGRAAYKASQTRNQEVVSEATSQIAEACMHCHQVYRDRRPKGADPSHTSWRCAAP